MYLEGPLAFLENSSTLKARPEMPRNQLKSVQVGYTKAPMSFDYVSVCYPCGTYPGAPILAPKLQYENRPQWDEACD